MLKQYVFTLLVVFAAVTAQADVRWLYGAGDRMVAETRDIVGERGEQGWVGKLTGNSDPYLVLQPVDIDAGRYKALYIKLSSEAGNSMQVFFDGGEGFMEKASFRAGSLRGDRKTVIYAFDLSDNSLWKGRISRLRFDIDGSRDGAGVHLYNVGISESLETIKDGSIISEEVVSAREGRFNDRMAAWHFTMVATEEMRPNSCVSTYVNDRMAYMDTYALAKLVTGVIRDGKTVWPARAKNIKVDDFPGGVRAEYRLDGVKVMTEIMPLFVGRGDNEQQGAALYRVRTEPAAPVVIKCGEGQVTAFDKITRNAWLRGDSVGEPGDKVAIDGPTAVLTSGKHPMTVGVATTGDIDAAASDSGGQYAEINFPGGSGAVLITYAKTQETALKLAGTDKTKAAKEVVDYYTNLLIAARIETPEKVLDEAFRSAIYNLEYNYIKPYGWNECIHHWLALWHMQHTGAAEWIGQAERSRLCNEVTAENLFDNGAIPQFQPSGHRRRDFGGSNQFWAWQIRHYYRMTGDKEFVARMFGPLETVIRQTFEEYDEDGNGLLSWFQQIGNQEDYVATPFDGTTPSIEGINMLRTAAEFAQALGDTEKARAYMSKANQALAMLRKVLWQSELGRYAFYSDPQGYLRLDGQYHTYIYPAIWDITDMFDSWTSMAHLRRRMQGERGECYCSNGFPNHVWGTWGMQAGAAQQPWAACGLASVGLRNETYRPLKAAAEWAQSPNHRGAWPEVSDEQTAVYFSPPAGLYIQSIVEALFGLNMDMPEETLEVAPSFPDSWPTAKLYLPEYSASYKREGNSLQYTITSNKSLVRKLRWYLPPCRIEAMSVNGKPVKPTIKEAVNGMVLVFDTEALKKTVFKIEYEPLHYSVECPASAAEGDYIGVRVSGCRPGTVVDRAGVFSVQSHNWANNRFTGYVRTGQMEDYLGYGKLGQLNFSNRTFFIKLRAPNGDKFWHPVEITILPRVECAAVGEVSADGIKLLVRNNSVLPIKGNAVLKAIRTDLSFIVDIPARAEKAYTIRIPRNRLALFSPGANKAQVILPGRQVVDVTSSAKKLFESNETLAKYAAGRILQIPLNEDKMIADTEWRNTREFYAGGHMPWGWQKPPMEEFEGKTEITVPGLSSVKFNLAGRKFVPVSWRMDRPSFTVDLESRQIKKLYLLVLPLFDNHDTWSKVARIDVRQEDGGIISRTLRFPGDLDWYWGQKYVGDFCTARKDRPDRYSLLPLLGAARSDWEEGTPPAFPQPEFWATCSALSGSSVMNIIEIDLGETRVLKSMTVSTLGVDPVLGIAAVSYESIGGQEALEDTDMRLSPDFREPKVLFKFEKEGDISGWQTEGDAFSVAPVSGLFTYPTLNSLAKSGERATGKIVSPAFSVGEEDKYLAMQVQGGNSLADDGPGCLSIRLVDADIGEVLQTKYVSGNHLTRELKMPVEKLRGRRLRLEMIDQNTDISYAWLGIREVSLTTR